MTKTKEEEGTQTKRQTERNKLVRRGEENDKLKLREKREKERERER